MNDFELIYMIRQKDEWSLGEIIEQSKRLIWQIAHRLYEDVRGTRISKEDMFQEGCLGLFEAIHCYMEDLSVPFLPFAKVCISREIQSLMRKYKGLSFGLLDRSLSLELSVGEEQSVYLSDVIPDGRFMNHPGDASKVLETYKHIENVLKSCSLLEQNIYKLKVYGFTYSEIATIVECKPKQVDNTLQKLGKRLQIHLTKS